MKKIMQTEFRNETSEGNCWIACIASILEIEISELPSPNEIQEEGWSDYYMRVIKRLQELGYKYIVESPVTYSGYEGYVILSGKSPRGDFNHAVVWKDGEGIVHDPHPDNTKILNIELFEYLEKIN